MKHTPLTAVAVAVGALATAGTLLLAAPATATTATTSTAGSQHTLVISSCVSAKYKPHSYVLTCADAGIEIHRVTYRTWTKSFAVGHGTYVYNDCTPNCAAGTFRHHPVTFELTRVRTVRGQRLFTRLQASYAGLTETFVLPTRKI